MENSDNFLTTKMNKPIFGITLFFILGITIGRYLTLPFLPLYLGLAVLFVLIFVLYLKKKEKGVFDWQRYLSYQGIWVELATGKVTVVERGGEAFLVRWVYKSRDWMVRIIEHTLPEPYSLVLKGIMLGDKDSLPPGVQESFLRTGTGQPVPVQLG